MTSHLESGPFRRAEETVGVGPLSKVGTEKQVPGSSSHAHENKSQATNYMALVSRGDRQAFDTLHQHYVLRVAVLFRRHPYCSEAVEDLTQEVFSRVWEKRERYHCGTSDYAWLHGFARIILQEYQAKLPSKQKIDSDHTLDGIIDTAQVLPDEQAESEEQTQVLRTLLAGLPEKQRQALDLTYFKGLSSVEASLQTGCSDKTLRNYCCLALMKLRTRLRVKH